MWLFGTPFAAPDQEIVEALALLFFGNHDMGD
jgi:hypothetical protein